MTVHEQFAEDLALLALGTLQGDERAALEKHMEECASCRLELQRLRGDMALMALSSGGATPPRRARQRLMDAVAREPRLRAVPPRLAWWTPLRWVAAAALVVATLLLWTKNTDLRRQIAALQEQSGRQRLELTQAREIVATLTATGAMHVTLVAVKTPPQPQGKAIYVRDRSSLIFMANNLPSLPPQKAYELWLIPMSGSPIPAGMFKPDARGSAMVINPPLPAGVEAKTFAITIEPEQGSASPTMPIVMMGVGG
ncbi:MAG TPA: anti-sigma factor [Terriglobales bacterium]|jgi:anti-sigma-K factor RskA|nr:anti-sigma factor [Terriglobales bacterium]